jgi:lipoprotein-anchoring transpeptidase ErfK/SrfK
MKTRHFLFVIAGIMLGGCMQQTLEPASDANLKPRDRQLLANKPYGDATIPEPYRRHIVDYHRRELAGTIVIDSDARYLYYVLPDRKAIRYGVTVGEEALAWSGIAKVGRMEEWPAWVPTADIKKRLGDIPDYVAPGPHNPMGARALYLFQGPKDTLYRVHGTNQPEYIGQAISSGCIRMTNEDVIDLYNRVKIGAPVVVLRPGEGDSPFRAGTDQRPRSRSSLIGSGERLRLFRRHRHIHDLDGRADIPLAHAIAARSLREIEMNVIFMVAVRAGPQHCRETVAGAAPEFLAKLLA